MPPDAQGAMRLRILTPLGPVVDAAGVRRLVVHGRAGAHGIRPRRLDCVLPLAAGVLAYEDDAPRWVAIDEGLLVKAGADVTVVAHRAYPGALAALREIVAGELRAGREADQRLGEALAALETQFLRGLREVGHGP